LFWNTNNEEEGSAAIEGKATSYVRYPNGHSELIGRGSIDIDSRVEGKLISEDGDHIIFETSAFGGHVPVQLESNAPPTGTTAVYDRTGDEQTHVVSLLPGDVTPGSGQNALYRGASVDGEGVVFSIGSTHYLRHRNEQTYEIGQEVTFAGIAEGGGRVFYVEDNDLFAFDVETEMTIPFSSSSDVTVVNVSADGSTAYFVSPSILTGDDNPNGGTAQLGERNLYRSKEGAIEFVGVLTQRDVEGENTASGFIGGLGLWAQSVGSGQLGRDPSRTTPDGTILLFESRAALTPYNSEEHAQVYRYDAIADTLDCLSCIPTQAPAQGFASLQTVARSSSDDAPFSSYGWVPNLRDDGLRAFFQSTEPLVVNDSDGLQDVYEWEAQGVGSCVRSGGCIYLISYGHSIHDEHIYALSDSGDDVFFRSSDLLLASDLDETPSIYDARVGGGFPEEGKVSCHAEACRSDLAPPPPLPLPAAPTPGVSDNATPRKHCPRGKRKVRRSGKIRCVKKHRSRSRQGQKRAIR
jgi:hypothetical protein